MKKTFMKKLCATIAFAIAFLFFNSGKVLAFTPPEPKGYVVDLSGKLSEEEVQKLNSKVSSLKKEKANEMAALVIPSLEGESIEDVAYATFNTWKIGKAGKDNGVLIVIAVKDRKSRIETGKGVGGEITDLQASDILKNHLNPYLKKGDFYGGLDASFSAINSLLESRSEKSAIPSVNHVTNSKTSHDGVAAAILLLGLFFIFLVEYFLRKRSERRLNKMFSRISSSRDYYSVPAVSTYSTYQNTKPINKENSIKYEEVKRSYPKYQSTTPRVIDFVSKPGGVSVSGSSLTKKQTKEVTERKSAPVKYDNSYYEHSSKREDSSFVDNFAAASAIASAFSSSRDSSPPSSNRGSSWSSSDSSGSFFSDSSSSSDSGGFGGGESGGGGASDSW